MAGPFFNRLKTYYQQVGAVLRGEAAAASIFPNTTDVGMSREQVYAEFLKLHLPSSCNVLFGGFLFNLDGQESKQIDLIITADTCPQYNFHNRFEGGKSFACVEGTLGVASIKSNLDSSELVDALDNLASLPVKRPLGNRVQPLLNVTSYEDWPFKIVYASKGMALESTVAAMEQYYDDHPNVPYSLRPDLIHVAGKHFISRSYRRGDGAGASPPGPPWNYHPRQDATDVLALVIAVHGIQKLSVMAKHILFGYDDILTNLSS
jgi:hypothetical protein